MDYTQKAIIRHEKGLHARVAAMVVQQAHELQQLYQVSLTFSCRGREKIIPSLVPLVSLRLEQGAEIWVAGQGVAAIAAVAAMVDFLESDFQLPNTQVINQMDRLLQDSAFAAGEIFASLANGLIVIDEQDIITVFNPAAEAIMGLSAAAVIGKPSSEVIPGSRLHIVNRTMTPELGCRQVIGNAVLITNRTPIIIDGQAKGAVGIFEDISAVEKLSWELCEIKGLQKRLELVLESAQDGICVTDREGYITYVNPAYIQIVEQRPEQLLGQQVAVISPDGARQQALRTGLPVVGSISKKHNGITVIGNANPIIVDGEVTGVVSIIKKVTDMQELMDKLQQAAAKAEYFEHELRRTKKPGKAFAKLVGCSGKMLDALAIAAKAAEGVSTVLIRGESGTGKELVAEGIHYGSARATGPFVRVNCAAIPANLLESELFGHEKGAFTGAVRRKLGKFELAHKGTIFLDEIGELEKSMQVKLLRVLQQREFERVGGEQTVKIDVRIIAATNRDLEQMLLCGEFRDDLYYRLNVIPLFLPPLRERPEDIPLLAEHFLSRLATDSGKSTKGLRRSVLEVLMQYSWPGNIRELENIMERVVTLAEGDYIEDHDLPSYIRQKQQAEINCAVTGKLAAELLTWEDYEKQIIGLALAQCGSYNAAGKVLGITHKTVAAKAEKYGIVKAAGWEKRAP